MSTESLQVEGNVTGSEAPVEETQEEQRPEWLPEKFKNPQDLANAYGELEKQFTQSRQSEPEDSTQEQSAEEVVESVGLDFTEMSNEYMENGQLSEETYKALENRGIPSDIVDAYIQGQESLADRVRGDVFNTVGGEDNYKEMTSWAAQNMNEAEKDAYNSAVNSGNLDQAKLAVEGLASRYRAVNGTQPNLVGGRPSEAMDNYQSWAQVTTDMKNPMYSKDPAFREQVERKLGRSKNIV